MNGREEAHGAIRIQNGKYKDAILILEDGETLWIGRNAAYCNLILEAPWISERHCGITYCAKDNIYLVMDCSENGTYFENGQRISGHVSVRVASGMVVVLGNQGIRLQLI